MKYITINKKEITKDNFEPIENILINKPYGGLWASPYTPDEEYISAWHEWCKFNMSDWLSNDAVIFSIKENANIYTIDSQEDLIKLIDMVGAQKSQYMFREKKIDFKMAALRYDAIYLTEKGQKETRIPIKNYEYNLYGWDCCSLLLLNISIIQHWEYKKLDII